MAAHSSVLAWRIHGLKQPSSLQSTGSQRAGTTERLSTQAQHGRKKGTGAAHAETPQGCPQHLPPRHGPRPGVPALHTFPDGSPTPSPQPTSPAPEPKGHLPPPAPWEGTIEDVTPSISHRAVSGHRQPLLPHTPPNAPHVAAHTLYPKCELAPSRLITPVFPRPRLRGSSRGQPPVLGGPPWVPGSAGSPTPVPPHPLQACQSSHNKQRRP